MKTPLYTLVIIFIFSTFFCSKLIGQNVGIGTTNPSNKLEVYLNSSSTSDGLKIRNASTGDAIIEYVTGSTVRYSIGVDNSDSDKLKIASGANVSTSPIMTFHGGVVGIGTSTPSTSYALNITKPGSGGVGALYATCTYTGNSDRRAVQGHAVNNPGYGYGGYFIGGYRGVYAKADATSYTGSVYGVHAIADASSGSTGSRYGLYAYASSATSGTRYAVYSSGDSYATGSWNTSDQRLKNSIVRYTGALDKIKMLNSYTYLFNQGDQISFEMGLPGDRQIGFLAQELEEVIPEAVRTVPAEIGLLDDDRSNDYTYEFKAVNMNFVTPVLVEAMKEQQIQIEELESEIADLKLIIAQIQTKLED